MIKITINTKPFIKSIRNFEKKAFRTYLPAIMKEVATAIWIPNIIMRLNESNTARSNYRWELPYTMAQLMMMRGVPRSKIPKYTGFFTLNELQRRGKNAKMGVTEKIANALSDPKVKYVTGKVGVYIGDIQKLNSVSKLVNNHYLWEILEYGTGVFSGGTPIVRIGTQVYFDRDRKTKSKSGLVYTKRTINKGQIGRHYFVQVNGDFYRNDLESAKYLAERFSDLIDEYNKNNGVI